MARFTFERPAAPARGPCGSAFVVLYGLGLLARSTWPVFEPYADTLLLAALGLACFINFSRNRTLARRCGPTAADAEQQARNGSAL